MAVEFDPCPNVPGREFAIHHGVRIGIIKRVQRGWEVRVRGLPCLVTAHGRPYEPVARTKDEAAQTLLEAHQWLVEALGVLGFTFDDEAALAAFTGELAAFVARHRHSSCEPAPPGPT